MTLSTPNPTKNALLSNILKVYKINYYVKI